MWSFDRTVTIPKPLVTFPWRSIGFYAMTGQSVITFKDELVKETIVEALEEIREQNPVGRILIFEDKDHFREFLVEEFLRLSHRLSFASHWIETFLPDVQKLR
ncbi:transposase [Halococcus salifodinae DSM 8989]|uniref:Transposase n=1 Tax=Halococcus salifodinae DSM 8989 TaxID=1227456 RepID=M0MPY0_9EURY|nr:transposase [Halococcus salifodinae DSM 8989]